MQLTDDQRRTTDNRRPTTDDRRPTPNDRPNRFYRFFLLMFVGWAAKRTRRKKSILSMDMRTDYIERAGGKVRLMYTVYSDHTRDARFIIERPTFILSLVADPNSAGTSGLFFTRTKRRK